MELNDNMKLQVLIMGLQERYNASHQMRARSMQFALRISGMSVGWSYLLIFEAPAGPFFPADSVNDSDRHGVAGKA